MYYLTQNWLYLLLALALGAFLAWAFGFCTCKNSGLDGELNEARSERDRLAALLAAGGAGAVAGAAGADDSRRVAGLEAELAEARVRADELAAANAKLRASASSSQDDEDASALKWRNRYLEARVKFLEAQESTPVVPVAAALAGAAVGASTTKSRKKAAVAEIAAPVVEAKPEPITNENFTPSPLVDWTPDQLEAAVLAAGEGKAPRRSRRRANPDDLLLIEGVGPKNNNWLNEQGIYYFHQIATMNPEEVAWLSNNLPTFGSRVYRENWVAQCARLAKGLPARD